MKTYFLHWESQNKRGHAINDFEDGATPREALKEMISIIEGNPLRDLEVPNIGEITAVQFNLVT